MKDNRESADCCRELSEEYGLKEVHEANLKMLKEIDRICRKYGIRYGLDAGTLIGAVRHQGFIPWDDDADVAFTRENYEKFARVVRKELPAGMKFLEPSQLRGGEGFYDFTPRILYMNSRTHEDGPEMEYYEGRLNHLWVDLFIMDVTPGNSMPRISGITGLAPVAIIILSAWRYSLPSSPVTSTVFSLRMVAVPLIKSMLFSAKSFSIPCRY